MSAPSKADNEDTLSPEVEGTADPAGRPGLHYLMAMSGPLTGEKYPVENPQQIIGRNPQSEIFLNDRSASRQHAEVTKQRGKVWIRDLSSRNGLFVNNLKVTEWALRDGDLVRIGCTLLQFVEAESRQSFYVGKYNHKTAKQREHPRFSLIAVGEGYRIEGNRPLEIISIKDISRAGIGLFTKAPVEVGADIRIAIYFKNHQAQMMSESVTGTVLSCVEWRGGSFMVSVRFHTPVSATTSPGLNDRLDELEQIS